MSRTRDIITVPLTLAIVVSLATLLILGVTLLAILIDKRFSTQVASFESLFLRSPEAIFVLDVDGTFRRSNLAAARLTGYTHDAMPARPLDVLLDDAQLKRLTAQLHHAAQGTPQQGDYTLVNQAGQQLIGHATIVPIIVGTQISGVYTIIRDITEQSVPSWHSVKPRFGFARWSSSFQ